jgi:hypothetical protein
LLGIDSGISRSEVSRVRAGLDEVVTAFRTRRLDHTGFPYVYLDATYLHVRNSTSQVVALAVAVAIGITTDGGREVLGLDLGDSEDEVLCPPPLRGLHGPTQPDQRYRHHRRDRQRRVDLEDQPTTPPLRGALPTESINALAGT